MTMTNAFAWLAIIAAHAFALVAAWKLTAKTETQFRLRAVMKDL